MKKSKEFFDLLKEDLHCFYDESGSIGRRYYRGDEIGTLFSVTLDFDSLEKNDATIRDRDSQKQIRVLIKDLKDILKRLLEGEKLSTFGRFIN